MATDPYIKQPHTTKLGHPNSPMSFKCEDEVRRRINRVAHDLRISASELVRELIMTGLPEYEKAAKEMRNANSRRARDR